MGNKPPSPCQRYRDQRDGYKKERDQLASQAAIFNDEQNVKFADNSPAEMPPISMPMDTTLATDIPNYNPINKAASTAYRRFAVNNHSHLVEVAGQVQSARESVNELQNRAIDTTGLSYGSLIAQNDLITKQIQENKDIFSTDNQKVGFQYANIQFVKNINFYLFILYYIFVFGLALYLYFKPTTFSFRMKILIVFIYILLPFIKDVAEEYIYYYAMKLWSIINVDVYSHKDY